MMIKSIGNTSVNSTEFVLSSKAKKTSSDEVKSPLRRDTANTDTCFISDKARQRFKEFLGAPAKAPESNPASALEALGCAEQALPENDETNILLSAYNDGLIQVTPMMGRDLASEAVKVAATIERLFNDMESGVNVSLDLMARTAGMEWSMLTSAGNKEDAMNVLFEQLLTKYVEAMSGNTASLRDLYVENGQIMGMPAELSEQRLSILNYGDDTTAQMEGVKNALIKFLEDRDGNASGNKEPNILVSAYNAGRVDTEIRLIFETDTHEIDTAETIEHLFSEISSGREVDLGLMMRLAGMELRDFTFADSKEAFFNELLEKLLAKYIEAASDNTVLLDSLYVEDGKIMGLSTELSERVNSEETFLMSDGETAFKMDGLKNALLNFLKGREDNAGNETVTA